MITGLVTVGLLCLLYEAVLVGVLALAQRREDERRELGRELGRESQPVGAAAVTARGAGAALDKATGSAQSGTAQSGAAAQIPADLLRADQSGARGDTPLPRMRASDAERQAGADVVGAAMAEGRLEVDEGIDRLDKIFRARYVDELRGLVADLPVATLAAGARGRRRTTDPRRADARPMSGGRGLLLAVVVTAFAVQVLTGVWVLWPVAVAALAPFALWRRPR